VTVSTTEIIDNPMRRAMPALIDDGAPTAFHRKLEGYRPTPLYDLTRLANELGLRHLYVKDESDRLGLPAFKILGASWASYRALVQRVGHEPEWSTLDELAGALRRIGHVSLTTATDGNHGRAVASFARRVGLQAHIFVPDGTSAARINAIRSEGASCQVVAGGTYEDAVARARDEAGEDCLVVSDTSWEGYVTVPARVIEGYSTIFREIDDQLAAGSVPPPDAVLVQSGVGALAAAAAARYRRDPTDVTRLICVEPDTADCLMESVRAGHETEVAGPHPSIMAGLNCGRPSPVAFPAVAAGFDQFCAIGDADAILAMRTFAAAGIVSGETGASGLAALLGLGGADGLGLPPGSAVLLLSTEGATDPAFYETTVGHGADAIRLARPPCIAGGTCPVNSCGGNCAV